MKSKFNYDDIVKDSVSKFQGKITSIAFHLEGCVQVGIQSLELKDGEPIDIQYINEGRLELVEAGNGNPFKKDYNYTLGDKVKDVVTGWKGIVTVITTYSYCGSRVCVAPDKLLKKVRAKDQWFEAPQLELIKAAKKKKIKVTRGGNSQGPSKDYH